MIALLLLINPKMNWIPYIFYSSYLQFANVNYWKLLLKKFTASGFGKRKRVTFREWFRRYSTFYLKSKDSMDLLIDPLETVDEEIQDKTKGVVNNFS